MKKTVKLISMTILAVLLLCAFAGCSGNNNDDSNVPVQYSIYCGLNDEDTGTQVIATEEAQQIARKIITDKGFGYTEHVTYGAYTENGKAVENVTLIYDLYFIEYEEIEKIADEIREALNLTPILIAEGSHNYELKD